MTGQRTVRVAVIDSGVHASHPHVGGVAGGVGIDDSGATHEDFLDRLGHGTAVTAAILEKAPKTEIVAIKVFDRELAATGAALIAACHHARERGCDLVNMSLGTVNAEYEASLIEAIGSLRECGAVVIAAGEQAGIRWLPGALPGAWAVTLDWGIPREQCRLDRLGAGGAAFRASGYPRPIPGVPAVQNLRGVSFAVANVTGIVASLIARHGGDPTAAVTRAFEKGFFT
ncbi:MAG TPA: S8 family serine peptidase [Vicinamibacterales bacterium]|nr:S8 family serine peptidase [Vicinamibacterales bacterium]